jgi:hypothetical protein
MNHVWNKFTLSNTVTSQLISDDFPGVLEILCHSFIINIIGVTDEQDYIAI